MVILRIIEIEGGLSFSFTADFCSLQERPTALKSSIADETHEARLRCTDWYNPGRVETPDSLLGWRVIIGLQSRGFLHF
jgi:hypothetical protein